MSNRLAAPKAAITFCLIAAVALAVALGGATASAAPAPIKVGTVVTEGASVGFATTASKTLTAFFKDYNAAGGFKGRKIEVKVGNDGFNAEKNVAVTKSLVDDGVVALVGNMAVLNCLGQAAVIKQANLYTLGYGNQAGCFGLKQFGSVNPSIPTQVALSAQYAKKRIGGKVCLIGIGLPGGEVLWKRASDILAKMGTKFSHQNTGIAPTANPTAALLEAKKEGCRSAVTILGPTLELQAMKAMTTQKITGMDLVLLNSYDYKTLKAAGADGDGVYFFSILYPFSENNSRTKTYRRFINKHKLSADVFGEQAYISAQLFVKALESIKGSVTRQSVGAAIAKLNTTNNLVAGKRFKFGGQGTGNAPIVGGYMLRGRSGKFVLAPGSELTLPKSVHSLGGK